jgi:hypothetical protein
VRALARALKTHIARTNRQRFKPEEIIHFRFPDPRNPYTGGDARYDGLSVLFTTAPLHYSADELFTTTLSPRRREAPITCRGRLRLCLRFDKYDLGSPVRTFGTRHAAPQAVKRTGTTPCCKLRSRFRRSKRSRLLFARKGRKRIASLDAKRSDRRKVWVCFR